jgi:hypothetical protein
MKIDKPQIHQERFYPQAKDLTSLSVYEIQQPQIDPCKFHPQSKSSVSSMPVHEIDQL